MRVVRRAKRTRKGVETGSDGGRDRTGKGPYNSVWPDGKLERCAVAEV